MKPSWLTIEEYPFRSHYFAINGYQLHYIDEGEGEVLLFVHGTPSWSFDFRHVIKKLRTRYRCIAVDHIGFGLSDKPLLYDYSTQNHSKTLQCFIESKLLHSITLLVHDFGGPIGMNMAMNRPDLFSRFVIINSWLWSSQSDPDFIKLSRLLKNPILPLLYRYFNFSARYILPSSFGDHKLSKKLLKNYTLPFRHVRERMGPLAFAKSLLTDQLWFELLWNKRAVIAEKPILLIWGMKDPVLKISYLEKFNVAFQQATVIRLEGCGHFPQEEQPEEVTNSIMQFLSHQ